MKQMGMPDHLTCLLRNLYAGQEATVRTGHGTTDWFQIQKEYVKAVYCQPAYLTCMQSTSWEMLGWRKHKIESRLLGAFPAIIIDNLKNAWHHPYGRKWRRTKELLDETERGEWKSLINAQYLEDKAMVPHSSTIAWKIPWLEETGRLQSMGSQRIRHDWATSLSVFTFLHWRRKWKPTRVFFPGESQGWGILVGFHLRGCTESDTTEVS